jgi:hypothetical protein
VSTWNLILSSSRRTRRTRRILKSHTLGKLCPTHRSKLSPPIRTHYLFFPAKIAECKISAGIGAARSNCLVCRLPFALWTTKLQILLALILRTECLEAGAILSLRHQDKLHYIRLGASPTQHKTYIILQLPPLHRISHPFILNSQHITPLSCFSFCYSCSRLLYSTEHCHILKDIKIFLPSTT